MLPLNSARPPARRYALVGGQRQVHVVSDPSCSPATSTIDRARNLPGRQAPMPPAPDDCASGGFAVVLEDRCDGADQRLNAARPAGDEGRARRPPGPASGVLLGGIVWRVGHRRRVGRRRVGRRRRRGPRRRVGRRRARAGGARGGGSRTGRPNWAVPVAVEVRTASSQSPWRWTRRSRSRSARLVAVAVDGAVAVWVDGAVAVWVDGGGHGSAMTAPVLVTVGVQRCGRRRRRHP
jgi:hypothetical protein